MIYLGFALGAEHARRLVQARQLQVGRGALSGYGLEGEGAGGREAGGWDGQLVLGQSPPCCVPAVNLREQGGGGGGRRRKNGETRACVV